MSRQIQPEFHLPTEIYIKPGISRNSSEIVSKFGTRAVIITVASDFEVFQERLAEIYSFFKKKVSVNLGGNFNYVLYNHVKTNTSLTLSQTISIKLGKMHTFSFSAFELLNKKFKIQEIKK